MPWVTILIALVAYIISKKSGASTEEALAYSALAGTGTYLLTHSSLLEGTTLAELDGVTPTIPTGDTSEGTETGADGNIVPNVSIETDGTTGLTDGVEDLLPAVTGFAAGTVASDSSNIWPWIIAGGAILLLLMD